MTGVFIKFINMSITASYVALAIMVIRIFLKKFPKVFSYGLWSVLLFRLLSNISFRSSFSILKLFDIKEDLVSQYVPADIGMMEIPKVNTNINFIDNMINNSLPNTTPIASVNPMQIQLSIFTTIWIVGIIALIIYSVYSYYKIAKRVKYSTLIEDNIFETDQIDTPFVLGIIRPRIYLPLGLNEKENDYIIKHEKIHIRRLDHIIKPIFFIALVLHWLNPIIWLSYFLMIKDMEMSCDESVMKETEEDIRNVYSTSMLNLSIKHSGLLIPLAFGESNIRSRIKNIVNYKKPRFWIILIALIIVIGLAIGLISNPMGINSPEAKAEKFLKTYYTIENTDIADIFYTLLPDLLSSQYNPEALGEVEGSKWQEAIEAKYDKLMTEEALDKALANRIIPEGEMIAKEFGSKAKVTHINLLDEEIVDSENVSYNYSVFILVSFRDNKEQENIGLKGSIEMTMNNGSWKVSKFRPNNGELEEALTVGKPYIHINNNSINAKIRTIEVEKAGSSSGAMNADNSDITQGARFSFDMIDTKSLNFKVRLLDGEKNILLQQDFTEDFSEGKDFHIYIKDGEDGKLKLEGVY